MIPITRSHQLGRELARAHTPIHSDNIFLPRESDEPPAGGLSAARAEVGPSLKALALARARAKFKFAKSRRALKKANSFALRI